MTRDSNPPGGAAAEDARLRRQLIAVTLVALLRLPGSGFGAPSSVYPDEAQYMSTALGMASARTWIPPDYHNPHFLTNLCFLLIGGAFGVLKLIGITPSVGAFKTFVWSHTFVFILLARWISAAA